MRSFSKKNQFVRLQNRPNTFFNHNVITPSAMFSSFVPGASVDKIPRSFEFGGSKSRAALGIMFFYKISNDVEPSFVLNKQKVR